MYRVAICDDNARDGQYIYNLTKQILKERNVEAVVSLFLSPQELLADITKNGGLYDLFLLDIIMEGTDGIELARKLRDFGSRAMLIYITVSRDYAIDGYKVAANDYLVKPVKKEALEASVGRLLARSDTILVKTGDVMKTVQVSEISYVEALGHYIVLQAAKQGEAVRVRGTLIGMQQTLGNERFVRCHKGYLVNLEQVKEIQVHRVLLRSGETIPLGRQYRQNLQKGMVQYVEKAVPFYGGVLKSGSAPAPIPRPPLLSPGPTRRRKQMLFNVFGNKENPPVLLLHGMMQDWRSEYELLKPLERHYLLIIPAQDGFYEESGDFTSFADQARQIEEYIHTHYNGKVHGAYGASQGGLMLTELLTRNKVSLGTVIMDGCYVAHQGRIAAIATAWMFKKYKNTGKFPALINVMTKKMGKSLDELTDGLDQRMYLNASDESIDRNFMENYTYRTRPEIAQNTTMVHLWCGSKEPYAIKSHNILKKYLKNYKEEIMEGFGHGEFLLQYSDDCCEKIHKTLQNNESSFLKKSETT